MTQIFINNQHYRRDVFAFILQIAVREIHIQFEERRHVRSSSWTLVHLDHVAIDLQHNLHRFHPSPERSQKKSNRRYLIQQLIIPNINQSYQLFQRFSHFKQSILPTNIFNILFSIVKLNQKPIRSTISINLFYPQIYHKIRIFQRVCPFLNPFRLICLIFQTNQKLKQPQMSNQDNKFDGVFMSVIQQKGNIDGFFDTVFGFLRRNTDFFANQKKAQESIVESCKRNYEKYTKDQNQKKAQQEKRKQQAEKKKKAKQEKERLEKQKAQSEKTVSEPSKNPEKLVEQISDKVQAKTEQKKQEKDDNQPAPKGNGGRTDQYIWTQTLEMLEMFIFMPDDVNKKLLKVNITTDKLFLSYKGETIIDGKWKDKINSEDSIWTIEDNELDGYKGKYIHLCLEKWKNQMSWWSTPIQGHVQINTQKINPEPSKLSDLDPETRSTVQKMQFDMVQKQKGLPTSDELQKQDKLKQFMKAHPEMDFSNCKFN